MEIREHKGEANIEKADHLGTFFSPSTNLDGSEINDFFFYNRAHQDTVCLDQTILEGVHTPRENLVSSSNTPIRTTGQADV